MKTLGRGLSGLILVVGVLLSGCSDPTAPGGSAAPVAGSYDLISYDGKPMPALYETASYGTTTVVNGSLIVAFSIMDISVNYTAQDTTGMQFDAYTGGVSAVWTASSGGKLTFGDGAGGIYTLTGQFAGDSILIAVPDTLSNGTAHTGMYKFVRKK